MAKAVLVMDMPESCENCKCRYIFGECGVMHRYIEDDVKKPDWCPLVELPEKIPEPKEGYETIEKSVRRVGWNACLDKILGR